MPAHPTNLVAPFRPSNDRSSADAAATAVEALTADLFGLFDPDTSANRFCEGVLRFSDARAVLLIERPGGAPALTGSAGIANPTGGSSSWPANLQIMDSHAWTRFPLPFPEAKDCEGRISCFPIEDRANDGPPIGCLFLIFGRAGARAEMNGDRRRVIERMTLPLAAALAWRRQLPDAGETEVDLAASVHSLNHELEQRVDERTQELARTNSELAASLRQLGEAQDQLIHAGKMAAVGALVAGLSHELNNPLGVIVGYVQGLLRRTPENAPDRASLIAIERQALRCAHLVRSLLDFSRNKRASHEETAIAPLVDRVLELVGGQARANRVSIHWQPEAGLSKILASPPEIESALLNLLTNALDATSSGGSVTIRARAGIADGRTGVELTVADTGNGIPKDILPRIFDPFFTTKPVGQGTGIGLALTRQIVDGHGGRIDVRSQENKGTTMRLWLPVKPPRPVSSGGTSTGDGDTEPDIGPLAKASSTTEELA